MTISLQGLNGDMLCLRCSFLSPLCLVLLAFNNTYPKTSPAGCNETLGSWFRAVQRKCPKHKKNYHTTPPSPAPPHPLHKPSRERGFHPKSSLPRWPLPPHPCSLVPKRAAHPFFPIPCRAAEAGCSRRVGTSRMKPRARNKAAACAACAQRAGCVR